MPNTWNLPPFEANARFAPAGNAGAWRLPDSNLQDLGGSLRVDEEQAFQDMHEPIRAIPDPWAQPRTFAEALIAGNGHSMFAPSLAQWRGLLATLALSEVYSADYTVTARSFELGEEQLFDRVLRHLTPKVAIGGDTGLWRRPVIFTMQNARGKALTTWLGNPGCLVSSGRLTADYMIDGVPWFKNGLKDPLKCNLPLTQLVVLEEWLRQLSADLDKFDDRAASKISNLVDEYADECVKNDAAHKLDCEIGGSLFVKLEEPFNLLGKPAQLKESNEPWANSQTQIQLTPPKAAARPQGEGEDLSFGNLKGIILADSALASDSRFEPNNTIIWGTRTLAELLESPATMESVVKEAATQGWAIITANDIFSERVVKFGGGANIPGNPGGADDLLLPLRPLTLLLGQNVQDLVSSRASGGSAVFTFKLPLVAEGEESASIELVRNYSTDPGDGEYLLVEEDDWNVAHASVWPNLASSAWHEYFVRINYPTSERDDMVRPETGISPELVAGEIADQENGQAAVDRLNQINKTLKFTPREDRWRLSAREIDGMHDEIQFSTTPNRAIAYFDALDGRTAAFAGLAVLDLKQANASGGEFNVAIDFGSTNTVACIEDRDAVVFQDRKIHPVVYGNPELTKRERLTSRWLFKRFFPADFHTTPSPTVALARVENTIEETHPQFRNLIYFHTHAELADEESDQEKKEFQAIRRSAHFNLKWSEDPKVAEAAEDFLRQFMHMVALEALADGRNPAKILWRFSIPDSMDRGLRIKFEDTLTDVTRSISTGVQEQGDVLKPLYSEGLAAANLILDGERFARGSINLVLDIGGSTTDVTIWDVDRLVWKGSFKLAGRNFFTSTISQNPSILADIGLGNWIQYFDTSKGDGKTKDSHLAEMLFSGPALQAAIDRHWNKLRVETGAHLRLTALTFLGMLAWYLGRIARKLVEDGVLAEDQLESPAFALCGRGAGLFKKMHADKVADAESEVTFLLQVFSKSAGIADMPRPQLFTTDVAKMEVVGGMIEDGGRMDMSAVSGAEHADNFAIPGIGLTPDTRAKLDANKPFVRADLGTKISKLDLSEIEEMVAAFEEAGYINLDLRSDSKQGALTHISNKVLRDVNDALREGNDDDAIEPPFISAARIIVHSLAMKKEERDQLLKVSFGKVPA